jgi:hypothetical protein
VILNSQVSGRLQPVTKALLFGAGLYLFAAPSATAAVEVDIRSFGVACNGATDDSPAFQAALNSLPSSGGAILRIPCQMSLRSGVRLSGKSDVTISGSAQGAGFKALSRSGAGMGPFGPLMLVLDRCNRCAVENLTIDIANHAVGAIGVISSTEARISNNTIHNTGDMAGGAVTGSGNTRTQYIGNTILGTTGNARGMWIGNHWEETLDRYPQIVNNTIRNANATGIALHTVGATISRNSVEYSKGAGIKVVPAPLPTGVTTLIEHNSLRNNVFNGLQLAHGHDMIVRNNTLESNRGPGLHTSDPLANIRIEANTIRNNDIDYKLNGWQGGIIMHQGENITIVGNTIDDSRTGTARTQTNGIIMLSAQARYNNIRIEQNIFRNHLFSGIQMAGANPIENVAIDGNTFTGNGEYSISIQAGIPKGNVTLCNNTTSGGRGELLRNSLQVTYTCSGNTPLPPPPPPPAPEPDPVPPPTSPAPSGSPFITGITGGRIRNDYQGWVGMRFRTGGAPVTVTSLGRIVLSGNSRVHNVALHTASGAAVAGGSVSVITAGAPAGQIKYAALSAPIVLQPNTTYILATQETPGGDTWYDMNATVTTTSAAVVETGAYSSDARSWHYHGTARQMYGVVGFLYK